jgi:phosphoserine aminotransferase
MVELQKPSRRPERPWFSSGPTVKRPGWTSEALSQALLGRGIRAPTVLARLGQALELTREVLEIPADWRVGFVPGSDTGAMEAALWSMLGPRRVQALVYENFGGVWATDLLKQLKDLEVETIDAPFGALPDLGRVDPDADLVFVWNGTTSGVRVPDAGFIAADREGIVICDATSAAFAQALDWDRLDVVTFSFQKALGGEAGIGVIALSPRGWERLEAYVPTRAVPKVCRLHLDGRPDEAIFRGVPVNTYSMLTVEDWLDGLKWAARVGGLPELQRRTQANFALLSEWVSRTPWIAFLAEDPAIRSETSVVLQFTDPVVASLDGPGRTAFMNRFCSLLEREGVGFDLQSHRSAPAGLRIWCGCTVETEDLEALTPWLEWAWRAALAELQTA